MSLLKGYFANDCFNKDEPFEITYVKYLDNGLYEFYSDDLENLIMLFARYQFFEIDNYYFTDNGDLSIKGISDDSLLRPLINGMEDRLNSHEFYLKLIFNNDRSITVPIKDYLTKDIVHSDEVRRKVLSLKGRYHC